MNTGTTARGTGILRSPVQFRQTNWGGSARHPSYQAQVRPRCTSVNPSHLRNVRPLGDYRDITGQATHQGMMTMGYICPDCGEGLPEDTPCPCTMGPDDEDEGAARLVRGPLTAEVADIRSPVRQFLSDRFTIGLRDLQRRYRQGAPPLAVAAAPAVEANPGTVGTAADWLLRFLLHPRPSLKLAAVGAALCGPRVAGPRDTPGAPVTGPDMGMLAALGEIAWSLGLGRDEMAGQGEAAFTGPLPGSDADPEHLARACWVLALLTEVFRRGPMVAAMGPLGRFLDRRPSAEEMLALAPPAALSQLAAFRQVFETALLPQLRAREGRWLIGPTFAGSALIRADADVIAAGLLLELKTSAKLSLGITDLFQVIGYALLDFDDEYKLGTLGIFSARYAYLATWGLGALLEELAEGQVSLQATRQEFRQLLFACQGRPR